MRRIVCYGSYKVAGSSGGREACTRSNLHLLLGTVVLLLLLPVLAAMHQTAAAPRKGGSSSLTLHIPSIVYLCAWCMRFPALCTQCLHQQ